MMLSCERMLVIIHANGGENYGSWVIELLWPEPKGRRKNNLYLSVIFYEYENRPQIVYLIIYFRSSTRNLIAWIQQINHVDITIKDAHINRDLNFPNVLIFNDVPLVFSFSKDLSKPLCHLTTPGIFNTQRQSLFFPFPWN